MQLIFTVGRSYEGGGVVVCCWILFCSNVTSSCLNAEEQRKARQEPSLWLCTDVCELQRCSPCLFTIITLMCATGV